MLNKKSVDDINVKGQRVLVRCDFNVPLQDGKITDENRLVAALPTIKKLIADGGKVILCSHLGKPKGEPKPELSLAPVAVRLSELLGQEVKFAADPEVVGPNAKAAVAAMKDGDVVLLENTRYRAEETKNEDKFSEELETYKEIPSDNVSFDQRPWMKSAEITDDLIEVIKSKKYDFIRCNYPNGDMVGHTGSLDSTIIGVEAVDLGLSRLIKVCDEYGVTLVVTADHGNADEMLEKNKKGEIQVRTAHSLNPVPFIIYDKEVKYTIKDDTKYAPGVPTKYGLANVAPTIVKMLGLTAPDCWQESMI